jgi:hypothetical protein
MDIQSARYQLTTDPDGTSSGRVLCGYPRCGVIASVRQLPIEDGDRLPWEVLVGRGWVKRPPVAPCQGPLWLESRHSRRSRSHAPARPHRQTSPFTGDRFWVTGRNALVMRGASGTKVQQQGKITAQTALEDHALWYAAQFRVAALLQPATWGSYVGHEQDCCSEMVIACTLGHYSLVTYEGLEQQVYAILSA